MEMEVGSPWLSEEVMVTVEMRTGLRFSRDLPRLPFLRRGKGEEGSRHCGSNSIEILRLVSLAILGRASMNAYS